MSARKPISGGQTLGMDTPAIRPATLHDCEALSAIYAQSLDARDSCMEITTSPEKFQSILHHQGPRECLLVVTRGSEIVGYGVVKAYSDRIGYRVACETSIYLDRGQAGKGYGSMLQQALIDRCREFEYHHVVAKIWASNSGSIRFHQRFGYEMVGVQKEVGHLAGEWKDVAILQLLLPEVAPHRPDIL